MRHRHLRFRSRGYGGVQDGKFPEAHGHGRAIPRAWFRRYRGSEGLVSDVQFGPKDHASALDFAFIALMHNIHSARHPWRVLFDCMPDEPLTFELGKLVQGVRISIRTSGHGGLVRMWRRFSGHCYEDNEKIELCVALWDRRHWLQVSALDAGLKRIRTLWIPLLTWFLVCGAILIG
ncbi:hypothetical protein PHMEG_00038494 [Phytophthora megakarya]|uniref:Uncharacterized protein n=1 Tax=Phytophthora megakarya TaxID=4795 RepID=A0A225UK17_9STRA|nr:hypothetical protein PHMEG_00038494 [Phytophthora megakarya]